ncbi:MAG: hypothetical protein LBO05_09075 [Deltaproteobacteria bacterium]|jgi:hypothetical protein|nr:hypothetical protein [Deltaproteobacteria bacterium]
MEELQQFMNNLSGGEWDATFAELAKSKELINQKYLTIRQKDEENRELKIAAIEALHKIGMPADDIAQRLRFSKKEVEAVIRSLPSS